MEWAILGCERSPHPPRAPAAPERDLLKEERESLPTPPLPFHPPALSLRRRWLLVPPGTGAASAEPPSSLGRFGTALAPAMPAPFSPSACPAWAPMDTIHLLSEADTRGGPLLSSSGGTFSSSPASFPPALYPRGRAAARGRPCPGHVPQGRAPACGG